MCDVELKSIAFPPGKVLVIRGVPTADAKVFAANVGHSEDDIAVHVSVRFDSEGEKHIIVLNSRMGGEWKAEQREHHFPLKPGKEFQMTITRAEGDFVVHLHDGRMFTFPDRLADKEYKYIFFRGDLSITGLEVR